MQAIVLAGGLGTRLRSVLPDVPKPLAPIVGRPFLSILLDRLRAGGFEFAVLSVGYRHELIRSAFGERFDGLMLKYAVEEEPLGTGGAVRLSARYCTDDHVFVLNGDTYVEVDFAAMHALHLQAAAALTVCAVEVADASRYGRMLVEGRCVAGFTEKGAAGPGLINAGVYLMRRDLLETLALPEVFSFEHDVLAGRLRELAPAAFVTRGRFIDIGVPDDYARAQGMFSLAES